QKGEEKERERSSHVRWREHIRGSTRADIIRTPLDTAVKRVVVRLAAVTLACLITAGVLAGGGRLIVFGTGLPVAGARPASSEDPSLPVAIRAPATPPAGPVAASPAQPAAAPRRPA